MDVHPLQANGHAHSFSRDLSSSNPTPNLASSTSTDPSYLNGTETTSTPSAPFDIQPFKTYLASLLPPVLGASLNEIEEGIFEDPEFEERVRAWAVGPSAGGVTGTAAGSGGGGAAVLYVEKIGEGVGK